MKITKTSIGLAALAMFSLASVSLALAEERTPATAAGAAVTSQVKIDDDVKVNLNGSVTTRTEIEDEKSKGQEQKVTPRATSPQSTIKNDDSIKVEKDHDSDDDSKGSITSESHMSSTASFVKNLLTVADREHGIGDEVRLIAKSQDDSAKVSGTAITHVEGRGKFKTFLVGADYKNIGILRSEMVKTTTQIEQLKALIEKAVSATDKATLNAQIKVLVDEQVKIDAFIKAHEDRFSLFGWFSKMINK